MSGFNSAPFDAGVPNNHNDDNNATELRHLPYPARTQPQTSHNSTSPPNTSILINQYDEDMFYSMNLNTTTTTTPFITGKIDSTSTSASIAQPISSTTTQPQSTDNTNTSFYQLAHYRKYFDVDTSTVRYRLLRSLNFIHRFYSIDTTVDPPIYESADLYTPFWLTTTLCFILTVTSNVADYIHYKQTHHKDTESAVEIWQQDFTTTTMSTSVLYTYLLILPIILYFIFNKLDTQYKLVYIISIVGYGLTAYVFASILCIYPNTLSRWIITSLACAHSSTFTVRNLYDSENNKILPALLAVIAANVAIALMLRLYFFGFTL